MAEAAAILARLLELHPKRIDLSLGRVRRLLSALGNPQDSLPPVIHVGGTNGKGSTIAFLRAILEAAGMGVHVYTSPHLVAFNERIRLASATGGKLISNSMLAEALNEVEKANGGAPITFFEATTAAALKLFADHPADVVLLEVGLGGRLDATNVIDKPGCSIITPISIDHVDFLGPTLESITREKAGILKRGVPAIVSRQPEVSMAFLEKEASRLSAPLKAFGQEYLCCREFDRLVYQDESGLLDLPAPRLAGDHQFVNAGAAIAALRCVFPDVPTQAYESGLKTVYWPGRLQNLAGGELTKLAPSDAEIWLDGAHNEAGGEVLAKTMSERNAATTLPLVVIYGGLKSKDAAGFLRHFASLASEFIFIPVPGEIGRPPDELVEIARKLALNARTGDSAIQAMETLNAVAWPRPPRILITGSLYLAGEILALNGTPPE